MDGGDLLPAIFGGIVEGVLGNALRLDPGNDLEALHDPRHALVLQPTVLPLRVLTDHHNVHILVPRGKEGVCVAVGEGVCVCVEGGGRV